MTDSVVTGHGSALEERPRSRHVVHDITRRMPVRARRPLRVEEAPPDTPLTADDEATIAAVVEGLRPTFQADGGDVEVVDVVGKTVRVRLGGVCADCGAAPYSLSGLQYRLSRALGRRVQVRPVAGPKGAGS